MLTEKLEARDVAFLEEGKRRWRERFYVDDDAEEDGEETETDDEGAQAALATVADSMTAPSHTQKRKPAAMVQQNNQQKKKTKTPKSATSTQSPHSPNPNGTPGISHVLFLPEAESSPEELRQKVASLEEEKEKIKRHLRKVQLDAQDESKELKTKLAAEKAIVETMRQNYDGQMERAAHNAEQRRRRDVAAKNQEITQLQQLITTLQESGPQQPQELAQQYNTFYHQKYTQVWHQQWDLMQKAKQQQKQQHAQAITSLKQQHEEEMTRLQQQQQQQQPDTTAEVEAREKTIASLRQEKEQQQKRHEEATKSLKHQHEEEIKRLEEEQRQAMASLKQKAEQALARREEQQQQQEPDTTATLKSEITRLKTQHEKDIGAIKALEQQLEQQKQQGAAGGGAGRDGAAQELAWHKSELASHNDLALELGKELKKAGEEIGTLKTVARARVCM